MHFFRNGDIEDFPGLDSLHKFQVEVDSGEVKVRARKSQLESAKTVKAMSKRDAANSEAVVIIGGGAAAETCAETLRQTGYEGTKVSCNLLRMTEIDL